MADTEKFGLSKSTREKLLLVFKKITEIEAVVIYGSRAKGNFRPGSDIDLTLKGSSLTSRHLTSLLVTIDDLMLPYKVDLSIFREIENDELVAHIERVGQIFD
jgi:uncharacterized protein